MNNKFKIANIHFVENLFMFYFVNSKTIHSFAKTFVNHTASLLQN